MHHKVLKHCSKRKDLKWAPYWNGVLQMLTAEAVNWGYSCYMILTAAIITANLALLIHRSHGHPEQLHERCRGLLLWPKQQRGTILLLINNFSINKQINKMVGLFVCLFLFFSQKVKAPVLSPDYCGREFATVAHLLSLALGCAPKMRHAFFQRQEGKKGVLLPLVIFYLHFSKIKRC